MRHMIIASLVFSLLLQASGVAALEMESLTPHIVVSEVMANALDEDTGEFIELINMSSTPIDLATWKISDPGDTSDRIQDFLGEHDAGKPGTTVFPNEYAIIVDQEYAGEYQAYFDEADNEDRFVMLTLDDSTLGNGLGNSNDIITLTSPDELFTTSLSWTKDAGNGVSLAEHGLLLDQLVPSAQEFGASPGDENNVEPIAELTASTLEGPAPLSVTFSVNANDAEDLPVTTTLDFGDGTIAGTEPFAHAYAHAGNYTATLHVVDSDGVTTEASVVLNVTAPEDCDVTLSEIYPKPKNEDDEFIELVNHDSHPCHLDTFSVDDAEGGSAPFALTGKSILPHSYLVLPRSETGIALNNSNESARLLHNGVELDVLSFSGTAPEEKSYSRIGTNSAWTSHVTPETLNIFDDPEPETEDVENDKDDDPTPQSSKDNEEVLSITSVQKVRSIGKGKFVKIQAIVTTATGSLSKKYLYVSDTTGGIQIYSSKESFPKLAVGDQVIIEGKRSESGGEARILIAESDDIQKTGRRRNTSPKITSAKSLGEKLEGQLVMIAGKVSKKHSSGFYLDDATGTTKVTATEPAHIDRSKIITGKNYTVTGIVSQTSSGYRVLPRSSADIRDGILLSALPTTGFDYTKAPIAILAAGSRIAHTALLPLLIQANNIKNFVFRIYKKLRKTLRRDNLLLLQQRVNVAHIHLADIEIAYLSS